MTQATIIPNLSQNPPARSDPNTFDSRSASLLVDLPNLVNKFNTVVSELNTWNAGTEADKNSTGASRTAAIASEQSAKTSALSSAQRSAVWASGVNYSVGYLVESPITARQYRCIQAGVSTIDPSSDTTRWQVLGFEFNTQLPNIKPTLNLNFAKTKILDPRITFTRNSIGTYFDQYGVMQTAQANQARFDHDPVTGESLGLLIEEQRTNLLRYSEQFDDAAWGKYNCIISANLITAPDGTVTADKIQETTTTNYFAVVQNPSGQFSTTYTYSCYAKAAERNFLFFNFPVVGVIGTFNLTTGVTQVLGGSVVLSATSVGNGWWRCTATFTTPSSGSDVLYNVVGIAINSTTDNYAGTAGYGIYIWGAQLEQGSFPTSYIPTTSTSVTRQADVAVMQGTNFSSWYRQDEGSILSIATSPSTSRSFCISDGTTSNLISNRHSSSGNSFVINTSSVVQASLGTATLSGKIASSYKVNDFRNSTNSSSVSSDTSGITPVVNQVQIGALVGNTEVLNASIKLLQYYPKSLSNQELQALSRP